MMYKKILFFVFIMMFGVTQNSLAEDSGFLSDYSGLEENTEIGMENTRLYMHPDGFKKLAGYKAIMIDQPEFSVAADSKIKSLKPDDMVALAEALRKVLSDKLAEDYVVVDEPGPDVLWLRSATSNLYLKKAKRSLLSYTPAGFVIHAVKGALTHDITKKISFVEVTVEAELLDSMSGERIVAFVTHRGQRKDKAKKQKLEPSSWQELMSIFDILGSRLDCRLDNARVAEAEWKNCVELFPEAELEEK